MVVAAMNTTDGETRSNSSGTDAEQAALVGCFAAKTASTCAHDTKKPRKNRTNAVLAAVGKPDRWEALTMRVSPSAHIQVSGADHIQWPEVKTNLSGVRLG